MSTLVAALIACSIAQSGQPDSARARAEEHAKKAEGYFRDARFEDALAEYNRAWNALSLPAFLFNIGQCHRELEEWAMAIKAFEGYLPHALSAADRQAAEAAIEACKAGETKRINLFGPDEELRLLEPTGDPIELASATPSAPTEQRLAGTETIATPKIDAAPPPTQQRLVGSMTVTPNSDAASPPPPTEQRLVGTQTIEKIEKIEPDSDAAPPPPPTQELAENKTIDVTPPPPPVLPPPPAVVEPKVIASASVEENAIYERWWFWAAIGGAVAVIAGGTAIGLSARGGESVELPSGSVGTVDWR